MMRPPGDPRRCAARCAGEMRNDPEPMHPTATAALALIEHHHVEHGTPSVMEMHDIRAAMEARGEGGTDPATLAHDTLMALGWRVEMVDGVI